MPNESTVEQSPYAQSSKPENTGGWTPCRERMPEDGEFVLALGKGLQRHTDGPEIDVARWMDGTWWVDGGTEFPSGENITHWMKLPNKPND